MQIFFEYGIMAPDYFQRKRELIHMKKILSILLLFASLITLASCARAEAAQVPEEIQPEILVTETEPETTETEAEKSPAIAYEILEIAQGDRYTLDLPKGEWSVSNSDVAEIDQFGELTGLAAGKTWLSATLDGTLYTIPVTVIAEEDEPEEKEPASKKAKYRIVVNKTHNYVVIYAFDDEKLENPLRAMICSTGKNSPGKTYTLGSRKVWNRLYGYVWGKYATVITGDFLFHSVPFGEKDSSTLLAGEYNKLGTTASAGCIRMTVEGAKWIYDYCERGSKVIFTTEDKPCPLPIEPAIHVNDKSGWDPTDPDEDNPWRKRNPTLTAVAGNLVALGDELDIASRFAATDSAGNDISDRVEIKGSVDTNVPGIYLVEARVTDDLDKTAEARVYLRVVAPKN